MCTCTETCDCDEEMEDWEWEKVRHALGDALLPDGTIDFEILSANCTVFDPETFFLLLNTP